MLAKKFHLKINQRDFRKSKKLIRRKTKYFIADVFTNHLLFSRFGVIISQKVDKKATRRNEIKRIIMNFLRLRKFHQKPGYDVLIICLSQVNQLGKNQIEKELINLLDF